MTLLNLLNAIVEKLNALIRATQDPLQQARLKTLRDVFDALSDKATLQLFDQNSADFATAIDALNKASTDADAGLKDVASVTSAINSAVAAANAVDKLLGFLAHLA